MRVLAHIEKIHAIEPIEGADNIQLAKVLDWQCVVKKNEFNVGDLAVYHEIDCQCPPKPEYEFLSTRKYRIRTIKLRGQISQGLLLPLSILPNGKYKEGQDVTEITGVTHYDPESRLNVEKSKIEKSKILKFLFKYKMFRKMLLPFFMKKTGGWPDYVSHTDEPNIQECFARIKSLYGDETFYVCEKVDYQSATFFTRTVKKSYFGFETTKKIFGVLSRTQWKKTKDTSLWWKNAAKFKIEEILRQYDEDITIQGESGDTNVQGNKYKIKESNFWVFNIVNNQTGYHYNLEEMEAFCLKHGLNFVPVLDRAFKLPDTVLELLEYSKGKSTLNKDVTREGVVIRLIKDGKRLVTFKVKNPDFLLKYEE